MPQPPETVLKSILKQPNPKKEKETLLRMANTKRGKRNITIRFQTCALTCTYYEDDPPADLFEPHEVDDLLTQTVNLVKGKASKNPTANCIRVDDDFICDAEVMHNAEVQPINVAIDSGARFSLLSSHILDRFSNKPSLQPTVGKYNLFSAQGDPIKVFGELELDVKIGVYVYRLHFIVCPRLSCEMLLGVDNLTKLGATLQCDKYQVTLVAPSHIKSVTSLKTEDYIVIPPQSSQYVPVTTCDPDNKIMHRINMVVTGNPDDTLLTIPAVCEVDNGHTGILVHNPDDEPLVIDPSEPVATASPYWPSDYEPVNLNISINEVSSDEDASSDSENISINLITGKSRKKTKKVGKKPEVSQIEHVDTSDY